MSVPKFPGFIEPLFRVLSQHPAGLATATTYDAVAADLGLSEADKLELLPSGVQPLYKNRCGWAHDRLKRAGFSESASRGVWRLTPAGEQLWRDCGPLIFARIGLVSSLGPRRRGERRWREPNARERNK